MKPEDIDLGLNRAITRRNLIQGVGLAAAGLILPAWGRTASHYPPTLNGLRGSHVGSFEAAHARALAGRSWPNPASSDDPVYDLVVVGGGISGLMSALLFRDRAGPDSRVLILDNHDDFGGHAKRNEFHQGGAIWISPGGSLNLEYTTYGRRALKALKRIGVDIKALAAQREFDFQGPASLGHGIYFDAEHFGKDVVIPNASLAGAGRRAFVAALDQTPLSETVQKQLLSFYDGDSDLLGDLSKREKASYLRATSYADFLKDKAGFSTATLQVFANRPHGLWGAGIDVLSVTDCLESGLPGLHRLGMGGLEDEGREDFAFFPDGNASVARLLVRNLIPEAIDGASMDDIVTAKADYSKLDRPASKTRIRLSSTAVHVREHGGSVAVTYVHGGQAKMIRARRCVLACYHHMIPYLVSDLPQAQIEALKYGQKAPMSSCSILIRKGRYFEGIGGGFHSPGRMHAGSWLCLQSLGRHKQSFDPNLPVVFQLFGTTTQYGSGATLKEQYRSSLKRMLGLSFTDYEREIRQHLQGLLGARGFEAARDILAITVNRWPHGYAYEYSSLEDPEWPPGQAPHQLARKRFGNIAIANSDAMAYAYVNGALDSAILAIDDLMG